jgi:hypothetical protein
MSSVPPPILQYLPNLAWPSIPPPSLTLRARSLARLNVAYELITVTTAT